MPRPKNVATTLGADDTTQPHRGETDLVDPEVKGKGRAERFNELERQGSRDQTVTVDNVDRSQSSTPTVPTDTSGAGGKAQVHGGREGAPKGAKSGRYRRKAVAFEATQWKGKGDHKSVEPLDPLFDKNGKEIQRGRLSPGDLIVREGDWIMVENGRPVVVSDAAFKEMFEKA